MSGTVRREMTLTVLACAIAGCSLFRDFGQFEGMDASARDASVVDGQVSPDGCTPGAEICNGLDDDCDGEVDENPTECAVENGFTACVEGACVFGGCDAHFGDCDVDGASCETDLRVARDHCGGCGEACGAREACSAGMCHEGEVDWLVHIAPLASSGHSGVARIVRGEGSDLFAAGTFSGQIRLGTTTLDAGTVNNVWIARLGAANGALIDSSVRQLSGRDVGSTAPRHTGLLASARLGDGAVFAISYGASEGLATCAGCSAELRHPGPAVALAHVSTGWEMPLAVLAGDSIQVTSMIEHEGSLFVTGAVQGTSVFVGDADSPMRFELPALDSGWNYFIAELTGELEPVAVRPILQTTNGTAVVSGVRPTGGGDLLVGGHIGAPTRFETDGGTVHLDANSTSERRTFFGPLDPSSGAFRWLRRFRCGFHRNGPSFTGASANEGGGIFALFNCPGGMDTIDEEPEQQWGMSGVTSNVLFRFTDDGAIEWAQDLNPRDELWLTHDVSAEGGVVHVLATTRESLTSVDLGGGALPSRGHGDIALAAFDAASGAFRWGRTFVGESGSLSGHQLAVESDASRVILTGAFEGRIELGPEPRESQGFGADGFLFSFVP